MRLYLFFPTENKEVSRREETVFLLELMILQLNVSAALNYCICNSSNYEKLKYMYTCAKNTCVLSKCATPVIQN